jgi:hypothetical protein
VKQTTKGWLMELCLGCDANTEFKIATMQNKKEDIMYATEDTSCCIRACCGSSRPFVITVSEGGQKGGKVHSLYDRPCAFPLASAKCCCFQQIEVKAANGAPIGMVIEDCWYCVPSFRVEDVDRALQYNLHQPTCCCGMCVDCCSEGCCNWRVPFNIYEPGKHAKGEEVGQVVKAYSGIGEELFTDADKFELRFPPNADAQTKSRLLGATFLINQIFFENSGGEQNRE